MSFDSLNINYRWNQPLNIDRRESDQWKTRMPNRKIGLIRLQIFNIEPTIIIDQVAVIPFPIPIVKIKLNINIEISDLRVGIQFNRTFNFLFYYFTISNNFDSPKQKNVFVRVECFTQGHDGLNDIDSTHPRVTDYEQIRRMGASSSLLSDDP